MANRNSKNWNNGSIFKKISASLTVLLFLASSNLSIAALANEQGGRGAAWSQFKSENPDLHGAQLNQAFQQQWNGNSGSPATNALMSLSPSSHVQSATLSAGTTNLQIINAPVMDLTTAGGSINVTNSNDAAALILNSTTGQNGVVNVSGGQTGNQFATSTGNLTVTTNVSTPNGAVSLTPTTTVQVGNLPNGNIGATNGNTKAPHHVKEPKVPHTPIVRVNNNTLQQNDNGKYISVKGGLALDLGSALETITLGDKLFQSQSSVTISVGGQEKTVSSGSKVTAAEYIAAKQALAGGSQTVTLDANGRATGGVVDLSAMTTGNDKFKVTNLTVPVAVTAAGDFGKGGDVKITGDLNNSGAISAFTSDNNQVNALIRAGNITNGGSITSAVSDLTLQADKSLNNFGDISASGNLTLSAGKTLTNSGDVVAAGNLNVLSPNVTNTGTLASSNANVNLDTPVVAAMSVNNNGGTIEALNGAINVRSADYAASYNSTVYGGDLFSKEVNAYTGLGTTDINVNELTGMVNTNGSAAHVSANTANLILGNQCLVDDPTYYNTGNIVLGGNITVGEKLAIIAGGNITATVGLTDLTIQARATVGTPHGQDIVMIAGANVTGTGSQASSPFSGNPPSGNATSATLSGASYTGGTIDLANVTGNCSIDATGGLGGNGGNILIAAFSSAGNGGRVLLNNFEVNASASGAIGTTNGSIKIIAGAQSSTAIEVLEVISSVATSGGDILLANAQPISSNLAPIVFNNVGAITSGNTLVASNTSLAGDIYANFIGSRGTVTVQAGNDFLLGNQIEAGPSSRVSLSAGRNVSLNNLTYFGQGSTGSGQLLITAKNNVSFNSSIQANGGILVVAGHDLISNNSTVALFTEKDGDTGNLTLIAGADFQVNANDVTLNGASSTGGNILFNQNPGQRVSKLSANSNLNGNGGEVNIIAYGGTVSLPGDFAGNSDPTFHVQANSDNTDLQNNHINGTINIFAGADNGSAITMGGASTVGTPNGTGSINIIAANPVDGVAISTASGNFGQSLSTFQGNAPSPLSKVTINLSLDAAGGSIKLAAGASGVDFNRVSNFGQFDINSLGSIVNHSKGIADVTGAGDRANTLLWTALGDISFQGAIKLHDTSSGFGTDSGNGGITMVATGNVQSILSDLGGISNASLDASSQLSNAGNIAVASGVNFERSGNSLNVTGSSGTGGSILFDGVASGPYLGIAISRIDAHSEDGPRGSNLDGGDISLISDNLALLGNGSTFLSVAGAHEVPGFGEGRNGTLTIVAPGFISIPPITNSAFNANNLFGGVFIHAATIGTGTVDVTSGSGDFGTIGGNRFSNGVLQNQNLFLAPSKLVGLNVNLATLGNINVGDIATPVFGVSNVSLVGNNITTGNIDARYVSFSPSSVASTVIVTASGNVNLGNIDAKFDFNNGAAGTIKVTSNSSTQMEVGAGSTGLNRVGTVDVHANFIAGQGANGTLELTNLGSGGIKLTSAPILSDGSGQSVDGAHVLLDAGAGQLDVSALGGNLNVNGKVASGSNNSNGGSISLRYGSLVAGGHLNLFANSGNNGLGGSISVENTAVGGSLSIGPGAAEISVSATGNNGSVQLRADNLVMNQNTNAPNVKLDADVLTMNTTLNGGFLFTSNLTATANTINARSLGFSNITLNAATMNFDDTALQVNLQTNTLVLNSKPGTSLTLNTGNTNGVRLDGFIQNSLSADTGDLTFNGKFNFITRSNLYAGGPGQRILATPGSNVTFNDTVNLFTTTFDATGFSFSSSPQVVNSLQGYGSWAGGGFPITLTGFLNLEGGNLTVISTESINLTGLTVNLDGATNGGNLTLLAGYISSFFQVGPNFTKATLSNISPHPNNGSIIGGANISARGLNGNGGRVVAIADGGTVNLGNINVDGLNGNGGTVTIIATDGIDLSTGTISANGTSQKGDVSVLVGSSASIPGTQIVNGAISGGGFVSTGATSGNVKLGQINNVDMLSIQGALSAGNSITNVGNINAEFVSLVGGIGTATLSNVNTPTLSVISDGTVNINATAVGGVNLAASGNSDLTITATSVGSVVPSFAKSLSITAASMNLAAGFTVTDTATLVATAASNLYGQVDAGISISLFSNGNIGDSGPTRFITNAPVVTATAVGAVYLDATNSSGVQLNASGSTTSGFFDLHAAGPVTFAAPITAGVIRIATDNADVGTASNPLSIGFYSPTTVTGVTLNTGTGNSFVSNLGGVQNELYLDGSSGNNITVKSNAVVYVTNDLIFTGDIDVTANSVINNNSLVQSTNGNINIQSHSDSGLSLYSAAGTFDAQNGTINIRATTGNLLLQGDTTYNSTANLYGDTVTQDVGSSTAVVSSFIYTPQLTINPGGSLVTQGTTWFVLNLGTLANNPGDVSIFGNTLYSGNNFAVIASGNINLGNTTIDLSGNSGGSLTLIAGYDFSVNTGGIQKLINGVPIDNFTPSATGGSITGNATINLSGSSGNGGRLIAVAHGSTLFDGSISLGTIDTHGANGATGGAVMLLGEGGINVGTIDTHATGGTSGNVTLAAAQASFSGGFHVLDGAAVGTVSVGTTHTAGDITSGAITANGATVTVVGGQQASDVIDLDAGVIASTLNATVLDGQLTATNSAVSNLVFNAGAGTGSGTVNNTGALSVGGAGADAALTATSTGTLSSASGLSIGSINFTGTGLDFTNAVTANNGASLTSTSGDIIGTVNTGASGLVLDSASDIGVPSTTRFSTNAATMKVDAAGDAYLKSTATGGVAFDDSIVGGSFDLNADSNVSTSPANTVKAASVILTLPAGVNVGAAGVGNGFRISNGATGTLPMSLALNLSTTSDAFIDYTGLNVLTLTASNGRNLNVLSSDISGSIAIGAAGVAADNDINLTTTSLTNAFTVDSANGDINITSNATGDLTLTGNAGPLPATGVFEAGSGQSVNVTALAGDLILAGITTYNSTARLTANGAGQSVITNVGSNSIATVDSFIFTSDLQNNGTLTTLNPVPGPQTWFVVNPVTNTSTGNLTLSGAFNNSGANLAFIAFGDVNLSGATIDLSGSTSGSLTIMAGFNFLPAINTSNDSTTTFGTFTNNATGGSISVGAINLQGTSGAGGNLVALANLGTITLTTVNASGTAGGGNITAYATGGVTTGALTATGGTGVGGAIDIRSGTPTVTSDFTILAGGITNGSVNAPTAITNGPISVGAVNAGTGSFSAQTTGILGATGTIAAHDITLSAPTLNLSAISVLTSTVDANNDAGNISITTNSMSTALNNHLQVVAAGAGSGDAGDITINWGGGALTLGSLTTVAGFGFQMGAAGGTGGTATVNATNNVTINTGAFAGPSATNGSEAHVSTTGDVTVNANNAFDLAGLDGRGAVIELNAGTDGSGTLALGANTGFLNTQANGTGLDGDGGALILTGSNITTTAGGSAATALNLTAQGQGNGDGGTIIFRTNSTTALLVGQPAKAPKAPFLFLQANASAGQAVSSDGDGGSIEISTGGNLTISDVSLVNAARGINAINGASFTFKAGTAAPGALLINGTLNAAGVSNVNGGVITLSSNIKDTFSINPTKLPKNGIVGNLNTGDGEINVTNLGGGILVQGGINGSEMHFTMGTTKGSFATVNGFIIDAIDELTFQASGGSIGGKAPISVITSSLQANTSGKGVVRLQNINNGGLTLLDSSSGASFTLTTTGSATLNDIITAAKGSISVRTGLGNLTVANNATITANSGSLTLQNGNAAGQILIGDGATVETQGKGGNTTLAVIANLPTAGTNPTTTSVGGITVNVAGKGVVFLGGPPNAVVATTTATVNAINKNVLFFGGAGSIVLGTGSTITADPPSPTPSVATAATATAMPAQSAPNTTGLFGFLTENAAVTSDLSVLNLNAAPQVQAINNATLMTASNANAMGSVSFADMANANVATYQSVRSAPAADEDNSYAVGYCPATGFADGAICSDSEIVDGQISQRARIQTIQHSDRVVIKKGNVLFVPFKNTTVETPHGIVHIQAKSITLVSTSENGLAVYDLEDQHKGSVSVESNGHNVVLSPGRHVTITPHHAAEFAQINAVETIAHRNIASTIKNGHRAHTSEFSVLSAMDTVKPLAAMVLSKNAHAKQIADRMMKTTAIILQIGGAAGKYQHYFKPRMTAMK